MTDKNTTSKTDTNDPKYEETPIRDTDTDLSDVDPDEEVTPKNVQAPVSDKDKGRQNEVLHADHVRLGFPANGVPRTDDERKRMEEAGLLDKK